MATYPSQFVNRRGTAEITSIGVAVTAANVVFTFPNSAFAGIDYRGTILIELAQAIPEGTSDTLPILLEINGNTKPLTTRGGGAVTVAGIEGTGFYQVYYNKRTDILQLL